MKPQRILGIVQIQYELTNAHAYEVVSLYLGQLNLHGQRPEKNYK
jgi:hypothetical protein